MIMNKNELRVEIQEMVNSISPLDQIEENHINYVNHWIDSGCELFRTEKPATPDIHLVCYFVPISPDFNQILLTDHKKSGLWLPPGGHVEPAEHPKETVKREAKEELGIDPEFILDKPLFLTVTITSGKIGQHTDVSLWYPIVVDPRRHLEYDVDEFHQIRWFDIQELPFQESDPNLSRFIRKMAMQLTNKGDEK